MKGKLSKSMLSLLLALSMLLGLLTVFAPEAKAFATPVIDGVYEIVPVGNTNYAWDVKGSGSGTAADQLARVCLNRRNSSDAGQKWVIQRAVVDGVLKDYYVLRNLENTRYLNLDGGTNGTILHFWDSYAGWAKEYIDAGASCGIVKGMTATTFAPEEPITCEQMMTIIYRVQRYCELSLPKLDQIPTFKDQDKVSAWAKTAVNALISTGLIYGDDSGCLRPLGIRQEPNAPQCCTVCWKV